MSGFLVLLLFAVVLWVRNSLSGRIDELNKRIELQNSRILELEQPTPPSVVWAEPVAASETAIESAQPTVEDDQAHTFWNPPRPEQALPQSVPVERTPRQPLIAKYFGGRKLEDVIGENLLAIIGGLFVIVGAVFFLRLAVQHGWIGETGRVALALIGGAALFGVGLWLAERHAGRAGIVRGANAIGSLHGVTTGTGIAVMFLGAVVGTRLYDLLTPTIGLLLALAIGAAATVVALRWRSQDLAGFGIVGALGSPVLVDAPPTTFTLALLAIALIAAVGVVVFEMWPWLLTVSFIVTAPQIAQWAQDYVVSGGSTSDVVAVWLVLVVYWFLILLGAFGHELRDPTLKLRTSSATVVFAVTGTVVFLSLDALSQVHLADDLRPHWLIGFAALHVAVGAAVLVLRRQCQTIAVFVTGIGAALLAAGLADQFDGSSLVAWWMAEAVALSWLYWLTRDWRGGLLGVGFGVLAAGHAVTTDAPLIGLVHATDDVSAAVVSLGSLIVGSLLIWRLSPGREKLGDIVRRVTVFTTAIASSYLASLITVAVFTNHLAQNSSGVWFDSDAEFALSILWSIIGLGFVAAGSLYRRSEFAVTGTAVACIAPFVMFALDNSRGMDVVLWLAVTALAGGWIARRMDDPHALAVAAWFTAATALHAVLIEAPLLRMLSVGSFDIPRSVGGLALACVAATGVRQVLEGGELVRRPNVGLVLRGLEVLAGALVVVLASTVLVTILTPEGTRSLLIGNGFGSSTDSTAQLGESALWGALALLFGLIAARRTAIHLAWFSAGVTTLAVLKTLIVGPTDGVPTALLLAIQAVGFASLTWNYGQQMRLPCGVSAIVSAGALTVLTLVNVPPSILLYGTSEPFTSALLVGCFVLLAAGSARVARRARDLDEQVTPFLRGATITTAIGAVYGISVLAVGLPASHPPAIEEDAQTLLSIVWGTLGLGALGYGVRSKLQSVRHIRIGAFILLGLAAAKVVLFDTSQLEATYRVLVFVGIGLLLLGGAYVDQRLQPTGDES